MNGRSRIVHFDAQLAVVIVVLWCSAGFGEELAGKGQWQSLSGASIRGTWSATLTRTGDQLQGNLQLTGSNVFTGGAVTGNIDALSVALGVVAAGSQEATFSAKLDGTSIAGEWQSDLVKDHGVCLVWL